MPSNVTFTRRGVRWCPRTMTSRQNLPRIYSILNFGQYYFEARNKAKLTRNYSYRIFENRFYTNIGYYYIALNIKLLKCAIKAEELACRYHTISGHLLDIAHLLGCLFILPLHCVAFDDVVMQ